MDVGLAGAVVFANRHAVVGCDHNNCLIPELQVINFLKNPPDHAINQLRLGRIVRPEVMELVCRIG